MPRPSLGVEAVSGRHGYSEYGWESAEEQWAYIRHRGAVKSAIRGARGQQFLRDLIAALDAMPEKRLVAGALKVEMGDTFEDDWGEPWGPKTDEHCGVCALGALGQAKGLSDAELRAIRPDDWDALSKTFNVAEVLAREVMWTNDELWGDSSPEARWRAVRGWAERHIAPSPSGESQ